MGDLKPKLDRCKRSLIQWRNKEFKNNVTLIKSIKDQLGAMANKLLNDEEQGEQRALKSRLHALWKREGIYWKQ